jgi:hypothetical protein
MDNNDLIGEMDSRVWVDHWLATISENPSIPTDEGAMLSWFANALMAGYDNGRRYEQRRDIVDKIREIVYQSVGAGSRPLLEDHPAYIFPSTRVADAVEAVLSDFGIPKEKNNGGT